MTPYPANYGAAPTCGSCIHHLNGLGNPAPTALCALKGRNTAPDSSCIDWVLWVATARSATSTHQPP